jgi:UDP-glucuronate 4-epimerase
MTYSPIIKKENIDDFKNYPRFKFYTEDIRNFKALERIFEKEKPDKIVHLAAKVGVRPSIENPFIYEDVNIKGALNLLELARKYKIENFICASSSSVYGGNKKIPFSETDPADFPISPYAATKKSAELLCYNYHHLYNLNIICLRFFTVYGPKGRPDMAPYKFTKAILEEKELPMFGYGNSKRDYTYIDDIISGIISCLDKKFGYEIINLGNSYSISLKYFIKIIEKITGKKAKIKQFPAQPGDARITCADISKARKLLNYNPKIRPEEGMKKFIKWYKGKYFKPIKNKN